MIKKILITGGAGFIGSNLALRLIQKGYFVRVLDNLSTQIHGNTPEANSELFLSIKDKVDFIKGDVTNKSDWEKALLNVDLIVHLAAETGTGQSMYQIKKYTDVNIGGTALMLDVLASQPHHVKKIIVASSRAIYGEGKYFSSTLGYVYPKSRNPKKMQEGFFEVNYDGLNEPLTLVATDEESKIHPTSVYGITKQNQEQMVMTVCPALNIYPVAFRYQNVYGPGQSLKNPYTGILSIFSTQIKNNQPINIFEDGKESRDFVFIDDVITATVLGIENDAANGQVFNVGTGVATNVLEVANYLLKHFKAQVALEISGNFRVGDIRHNFADLTKIKNVLQFEPKISFDEGIKQFTDWVNQQTVQQSRYAESLAEMREKGLMK